MSDAVQQISYEGNTLPNDDSKLSEFFIANGSTLFVTLAGAAPSSAAEPLAAPAEKLPRAADSSAEAGPAAQHMHIAGNILSEDEVPRAVTVRNLPPLSEDGVHKALQQLFAGAAIARTVVQQYAAGAAEGDSEAGRQRAQALVLFDTPAAASAALLQDGAKVGAYAAQVAPASQFAGVSTSSDAAAGGGASLPGRYDTAAYASEPVARFLAQGFVSGQRGLASVKKYWAGVETKASQAFQKLAASRPAVVLSATATDLSRRAVEYDQEHKLSERASSSWNKLVGRVTGAAKDMHERASTNTTVARGLHSVVHAYRVVEAAVDGTLDATITSVRAAQQQEKGEEPAADTESHGTAQEGDSVALLPPAAAAGEEEALPPAAAPAAAGTKDRGAGSEAPAQEPQQGNQESKDVFGDSDAEDTAV